MKWQIMVTLKPFIEFFVVVVINIGFHQSHHQILKFQSNIQKCIINISRNEKLQTHISTYVRVQQIYGVLFLN